MKDRYSQAELDEVRAAVAPRTGWDFSRMNDLRAPVPWEYTDVVSRYLRPGDDVLDIGTGGGERFASLASSFRSGLGIDIDPEMVRLAQQRYGQSRLQFRVDTARLETVSAAFPVIINRHAPLELDAVAAHLEPAGYFITQQVGERNMACVAAVLGRVAADPPVSPAALRAAGLAVVAFGEYDVEYVVSDLESLVFWLSALDLRHADLAGAAAVASAEVFNSILAGHVDHRGFVTNEHRYLAVGRAAG